MEKRTTLLLVVVCAVALSASTSCGGKNPAEPTGGVANAPVSAAGDDDEVAALANTTMRWSLIDRCAAPVGFQWRLFDVVSNKRFPTTGVYRTPNGGAKTATISCTTRHKICIGGTTLPSSSFSFGVGLTGTRRSGAILRSLFCRACSPISYRLTFSCPRRADGLAPGDDEGWSEEESTLDDAGLGESFVDDSADGEEVVIE